MSSQGDAVHVRESLFSSVSSDQIWTANRCGLIDDFGGERGDPAKVEGAGLNPRSPCPGDGIPAGHATAAAEKEPASAQGSPPTPCHLWKGGRGRPWRGAFASKPRSLRRAIVAAPWTSPIAAHHLAAVEIQRFVRGRIAKKRLVRHRRGTADRFSDPTAGSNEKEAAAETSWSSRGRPSATGSSGARRRRSRATGGGCSRQLDKYLRHVAEVEATCSRGGGDDTGAGGGYSEWCGRRIQAWWRMVDTRFKFRYLKIPFYGMAALQIQYAWRDYQQNTIYDMSTREIASTEEPSFERGSSVLPEGGGDPCASSLSSTSLENAAAKAIQTGWRSRVSKSIYRYYRNVIDFRLGGDPRLLLRAINPGEASLFDRAAGVHVRFRLGGYTFPPSIYYKVYTHQPVADIGAFAPRAYSEDAKDTPAERWNQPPATGFPENPQPGQIRVGASYFGASVRGTGPQGTKNWYRRHENNSWRPITIKTLSSAEDDPVTIATAKDAPARSASGSAGDGGFWSSGGKGGRLHGDGRGSGGKGNCSRFHYSKVVREECRVARMKRRKRRWLASMYSAGLVEGASSAEGGGDQTTSPSLPRVSQSRERHHQQHQGRPDDDNNHFKRHESRDHRYAGDCGMVGPSALGLEERRGHRHGGGQKRGWSQNERARGRRSGEVVDNDDDDGGGGALLVRWSEDLDFDRYLSEWRQIATSGPSEPWRNADDFAECVATRGVNLAPSSTPATAAAATTPVAAARGGLASPAAPTTPKASAVNGGGFGGGDGKNYLAGTSKEASTSSDAYPFSLSRVNDAAGGARRGSDRSSVGFDVGERKGGALAFGDSGGGRVGGGGGGRLIDSSTTYRAFDSIPVDLGSM